MRILLRISGAFAGFPYGTFKKPKKSTMRRVIPTARKTHPVVMQWKVAKTEPATIMTMGLPNTSSFTLAQAHAHTHQSCCKHLAWHFDDA